MESSYQHEHKGFVKILNFKIKHVEVSEYVSLLTGVKVFFMRYETPLVNTYVIVPTREETDEGLPHTLEHLIFLGSEKYPSRGVLDLVSCKSLSSGTNAWTSTDHTAYTLSTAGLEGTLQMLPIYLDHILRPSLTEIGFMTDIHHVTSDGSSTGVAYCEMKSRENHPDEMMFFEALDNLYPGDSGYKRNTGGKLSGLRSTNIHRVREFHKKFYKWNNLSIVLCGNVNNYKAVLELVHDLEKSMDLSEDHKQSVRSSKRKKTNNMAGIKAVHKNRLRVWDDPKHVEKLERSTVSTLYFPCEQEESGTFSMSWRGPSWEEFELVRSVSLMGSYLVDSTASPLEKALIHTSDPLGSCVDFSIELFKESYFQLVIKDVPVKGNQVGMVNCNNSKEDVKEDYSSSDEEGSEHDQVSDKEDGIASGTEDKNEENNNNKEKMELVEDRLRSELLKVYENKLDMERMKMLIRRGHNNYLRQIETCAHETLIDNLIGYVIYGSSPEQLEKIMVDYEIVERLLEKDEEYWKHILNEYFIKSPSVSVRCIPSVQRSKEIQEEEKNLMETQMNKYGKEKLVKNKNMVEEELNKNKSGPPKEILNQFRQCDSRMIELPTYPLYRNFKYSKINSENHKRGMGNIEEGLGISNTTEGVDLDNIGYDVVPGSGSVLSSVNHKEHSNKLRTHQSHTQLYNEQTQRNQQQPGSDFGNRNLRANGENEVKQEDYSENHEDKRRRRKELERFMDELNRVKYPIQVNNIPTDFVRIYVVFSTCKLGLSEEEKRLLFLLCVLLFESNVYFGEKLVTSEEFISTLMENTTSYGCNLGLSSSALLPDAYSELFTLYLTCPVDNYDRLLEIFYNVLYNIKYDSTILTKHVKSLLNSFSKKKRSPKTLLKQLSNYLKVDGGSVRHLCSLGHQDRLLKNAMSDPDGARNLEEQLKKLHFKIFNVENMSVHLTVDLSKVNDNWLQFWVNLSHKRKLEQASSTEGGLKVLGSSSEVKATKENYVLKEYFGYEYGKDKKLRKSTGYLSSLASTDVSHLCVSIPAPYGYNHQEYFAILTCCEYLTMTEGPLYRAIRGGGYAYHHRVSYLASQGEIQLVISEATDLINALRVTSESIVKCADENVDIDQDILAAKSSLIYRILSNEESLADYSQETYTNALRETDVDFNKFSVVQIQKLEIKKIREVFSRYFKQFLDFEGPPKTLACIASKTEAETISNGFKTVNYCNVKWLDSKSLLSLLSSSADAQDG